MRAPTLARTRLKYISRFDQEKLSDTTDPELEFEYVDVSDVTQGEIALDQTLIKFVDAPSRARRLARPGDTVISTVRTYLKAVAQVPECDRPLVFSTGLSVFRPNRGVDARWLSYALQSQSFIDEVEARSTGVSYPAISPQEIASLSLPLPDERRQAAIADFLDRETARIDTLIEKQEKLIETLKDRRSAEIGAAVTRGLPSARTVGTVEVPWLGRISVRWRAMALRRLGQSSSGSGFPHEYQGRTDLPIPFVKVKALGRAERNGMIYEADDTVDASTARVLGATIFPKGTLIYAKVGAALLLGRIRMLGTASCLDNNMSGFVIRSPDVEPRFMYYAMSQIRFPALLNPGAVPSLSERNLASHPIAMPPLSEQREIVSYLDTMVERFNNLIAKAERFIELAKERRSALITAAVTGQIEVGEEAPVG